MQRYLPATLLVLCALSSFPLLAARKRIVAKPPPPPDTRQKPFSDVIVLPETAVAGNTCAQTLHTCSINYCFPGTNSACLQAGFQDGQAWRACIYATQYGAGTSGPSKGLAIGPVDFRTTATAPWQRVIYTAGTAEIFTGYDYLDPLNNKTRLYDTFYANWSISGSGSSAKTNYNWSNNRLTPAHVGPNGVLVTLSQDAVEKWGYRAAAECRDRGLAWLCHGRYIGTTTEVTELRRGEEMVLWGVYDAGNYDYIIEYGFRDDGTIAFRAGATGYNNRDFQRTQTDPNKPCPGKDFEACGNVPHVHDVMWRVDLDLRGGLHDSVREEDHLPANLTAPHDDDQMFNFGHEGGIDWDPDEYRSVVIEDVSRLNAFGNHPGYSLHPLRFGNGRHAATAEEKSWALHDIWITQWHPSESTTWAETQQYPDKYLPGYAANAESIDNRDVVLWYSATAHHDPADEDRQSNGQWGVTLAHFIGFELNPHNLFEANPLGQPAACDRLPLCGPCTN